MTNAKLNFDEIAGYIKKYDDIRELAKKYKQTPAAFLDFFCKIGNEVLLRSNDELINELNKNLKTFVSSREFIFSDTAIKNIDALLNSLKALNSVKASEFINDKK